MFKISSVPCGKYDCFPESPEKKRWQFSQEFNLEDGMNEAGGKECFFLSWLLGFIPPEMKKPTGGPIGGEVSKWSG